MSGILVVTGASRGIGAAAARIAAREGFAVCLNAARSIADAETVAAEIRGGGGRAIAVQADVSRRDDVARLFATCDRELGTPTALINNAAIVGGQLHRGPPRALDVDLDAYPFPDWDLLPFDRYSLLPLGTIARPIVAVAASRGCPFRCSYCALENQGKSYRKRSARTVVDAGLVHRFGGGRNGSGCPRL